MVDAMRSRRRQNVANAWIGPVLALVGALSGLVSSFWACSDGSLCQFGQARVEVRLPMGLAADGTTVQVQIEEAGRIVATSPAAVPVDGGGRAVIDLAFPAGYPRHSRVLVRATARRAGRIVGLSAVEKTLSEKCLVTTIHLFPEPEPIDAAVSPDGRSTDAPASEDTTSRGDAGPDDANPGDDGSLSPVDVRDAHGPDGAIDAEVGREADATAGEDALDPDAT